MKKRNAKQGGKAKGAGEIVSGKVKAAGKEKGKVVSMAGRVGGRTAKRWFSTMRMRRYQSSL